MFFPPERAGSLVRGLGGTLLLLLTGACTVGVDLAQEGFPCNPDGSCEQGLICERAVCVLPEPDGGALDAGPDGGTDAGPGDAGPDGGCAAPCTIPTGAIVLSALPPSLPSDGTSVAQIRSDPILDASGLAVPDGTRIALSVDLGGLSRQGSSPTSTLEVPTAQGTIAFDYVAGARSGTATLEASSVQGDARGQITIPLLDVAPDEPVGTITLTPDPAQLPADGATTAWVSGDPIFLQNGAPVPDGTLFTLATTDGSFLAADADPTTPGLQVAQVSGSLGFLYQAGLNAGTAIVSARSVRGAAYGEASIPLLVAPGASSLVVTPAQVVADGVAAAQIAFSARDGAGAPVAITSAVISVDRGSLMEIASPGVGERLYLWSSVDPGPATATVVSVDGITWGAPAAQLRFLNAPPVVSVSDVLGRIPYDTVSLPITASDPNPQNTLSITLSISGASGSFSAFLHHPTQGGPFATLTTSPQDLPVVIPERAGIYAVQVDVSDGQASSSATFNIEVRDFVPISLPGVSTLLNWQAPAIDPGTGDVCLGSRDLLIAMRSEATGNWTLLDVSPYLPSGLKRPPVAWSHDPVSGTRSCLLGTDGGATGGGPGTEPTLIRISPGVAGNPDAWLFGPLNESRGIVSMAEGPSGEVWMAFAYELGVLDPGAPGPATTYDFLTQVDTYDALGLSPSGVLLVMEKFGGGYFRTALPFDPSTPKSYLTASGSTMSQPSFVTGPAGTIDAWVGARSSALWRLPDIENQTAVAATPYFQSRKGFLLEDTQPVQRSSPDGDVWMASKTGVLRYVPFWDQWAVLPAGGLNSPGLAGCTKIDGIAIDSAAPQTRGRRLLVACKDNGLFELIGDP